jgi:molybdopterin/thiamine biosynthesis adenylyltransferase
VVAGYFTGASQELVKNLVLKGVGRVVLLSWDEAALPTVGAPLLLFPSPSGATNIQLSEAIVEQATMMNPSVEVCREHVDFAKVESILDGACMLVLVNEFSLEKSIRLDEICRKLNVPFEWILTNGSDALFINDLHNYTYTEEKERMVDGAPVNEMKNYTLNFPTLEELWMEHKLTGQNWQPPKRSIRSQPASYSQKFATWQDNLEVITELNECAPVNAIIGAISAQEVIKVATGRDRPIHNVVLFEGRTLQSTILSIKEGKPIGSL